MSDRPPPLRARPRPINAPGCDATTCELLSCLMSSLVTRCRSPDRRGCAAWSQHGLPRRSRARGSPQPAGIRSCGVSDAHSITSSRRENRSDRTCSRRVLLTRPFLAVRDARRIGRFARQHQLTTEATPLTARGHHQRAKRIDQTPRLALRRGDRQRQADHDCRRADCVPHGRDSGGCGPYAGVTFTCRRTRPRLSAQCGAHPKCRRRTRNVGAGTAARRSPRTFESSTRVAALLRATVQCAVFDLHEGREQSDDMSVIASRWCPSPR